MAVLAVVSNSVSRCRLTRLAARPAFPLSVPSRARKVAWDAGIAPTRARVVLRSPASGTVPTLILAGSVVVV